MLRCMICGKPLDGNESFLTLVTRKGDEVIRIAAYLLCENHGKDKEIHAVLKDALDEIIKRLKHDYEFAEREGLNVKEE